MAPHLAPNKEVYDEYTGDISPVPTAPTNDEIKVILLYIVCTVCWEVKYVNNKIIKCKW